MPAWKDWVQIIVMQKGKVPEASYPPKTHRRPVPYSIGKDYDVLEAVWTYNKPGDAKYKIIRDEITREMRRDGWKVEVETTSLDYYLQAKRRRKP